MSDLLPQLPFAFQAAHDVASPSYDNMVSGTITEFGTFPHFERGGEPMQVVTLTLDSNKGGIETARAFIHNTAPHDIVGRRLRGKLMIDDKAQRDITKHGVTGYNWKYAMMKHNPGVYFDIRTLHLAADDPVMKITGNVSRENLNVFGITHIDAEYYQSHGYDLSRRPTVEAKSNPWKRLFDSINPFKKSTASETPQLEHHP